MRIKQYLFERCLPAVALVAIATAGCGDQQGPQDPSKFYELAEETEVEDPIGFTDQNYDFTGDTPISKIHELFNTSEQVWYGVLGDEGYPMGSGEALYDPDDPNSTRADGECDDYGNIVEKVADEPMQIEGVVTLHPRYFQKVSVCGQDQRFYGSFFLQDASSCAEGSDDCTEDQTGGILVLRDGRVTGFSYGDRVSLRVRAIMTSFGQPAVLMYDQEEVVEPGNVYDVYYETLDREFEISDASEVRRIEGTITSEPTSDNFNELVLEGDNGSVWTVSIDRELANRGLDLQNGDRVQLTGPVINSYGLNLLIASKGQIEHLGQE